MELESFKLERVVMPLTSASPVIEYNWNNLVNPKMIIFSHAMNTTYVLTTYMWYTIDNMCLYLTSVF